MRNISKQVLYDREQMLRRNLRNQIKANKDNIKLLDAQVFDSICRDNELENGRISTIGVN